MRSKRTLELALIALTIAAFGSSALAEDSQSNRSADSERSRPGTETRTQRDSSSRANPNPNPNITRRPGYARSDRSSRYRRNYTDTNRSRSGRGSNVVGDDDGYVGRGSNVVADDQASTGGRGSNVVGDDQGSTGGRGTNVITQDDRDKAVERKLDQVLSRLSSLEQRIKTLESGRQ